MLFVLVLACALELPFVDSRVERDSGIHMTAACEILRGRVMYRDLWENRPPGIHYSDALAFRLFGESRYTIRACNVALISANTLAFFLLARRLIPGRLVYGVCAVFMLYLGGHYNRDEFNAIELYMVLPMMLTVLCGGRLLRGRGFRWAAAAGACTAVAFLYKQPAASAGAALALVIAMVHLSRRRAMRRIALTWLAMAVGAAAVLGPVALYFGTRGALGDAWDATFHYNRLYLRGVGMGARTAVLWHGLTREGSALPLWLGAAALISAGAAALRRARRLGSARLTGLSLYLQACKSPGWVLVAVWAVLDLAGVCYPGFKNPHYFLQVIPSWLLLSGGLIHKVWPTRGERPMRVRWVGILILGAASVWLARVASLQAKAAQRAVKERIRDDQFNRNEALGVWVRKLSEPDEPLCIWGAEATVHFHAARRVASKYFFTYPLQMPDYDNARRVAEFVADLGRSRPAYIIDLSDESDYAAPLFGSRRVPYRFSYSSFGLIRDYVTRHYVRHPVVKVAKVWVRRDLAGRYEQWMRSGRVKMEASRWRRDIRP